MDPGKTVQSGSRSPGSRAERRSTFSLPFAFMSPSRRHRHNPSATISWRRNDSQTSSSDSQKQSHWVQDLHRRSLHKARSGLLALRAGFRRPRTSSSVGCTPVHHQEVSTASTQEDLGFGVALYRTNVPWPTAEDEPSIDVLMRAAAFHPLANIASAPEARERPAWESNDADAVFSHGSIAFHPPAYRSSCDDAFDSQNSPVEVASKNDIETGIMTQEITSVHVHSGSSTDWETVESTSAGSAEERDLRIVDDSQPIYLPEQKAGLQPEGGAPNSGNLSISHEETESDEESHGFRSWNRRMLENRRSSFMRRSSGVLSTLSSNASHRRRISLIQSEAFGTQERLLLYDQGPPSPAVGTCSDSASSLGHSSADIPFAFPGLYQELLEQWVEDRNRSRSDENVAPTTLPSHLTMPTVNFLFNTPPRYEYTSFYDENNHGHQRERSLSESDLMDGRHGLTEGLTPSEAVSGPSTGDDLFELDCRIPQPESVTTAELEERRNSFGLHISMRRNESRLNTSRDEIYPVNEEMNQPFENNQSYGRFWSYDASENRFRNAAQSVPGYLYMQGSATSPEFRSPTSTSTNMFSPLSSPIDEEVLFPNSFGRNEFWYADGKTSSLYPDRGDQPVQSGLQMRGRAVHSGSGLDRIPSNGYYQSRETKMPFILPRSSHSTVRDVVMSGESDTTDESYPRNHQNNETRMPFVPQRSSSTMREVVMSEESDTTDEFYPGDMH
ncbi:hypothetical protein N7520_004635 [Penicillium odoratum]|uniref:uncharacterized protein n=1 Tax=Penicillium odoratum TaxID=1167516 RepID=UPI0025473B52|nr:uncharacterized protein N7520_004635 [Penicillium odoratum]KAJ5765076.1 hypothetical protein N7520_004635 [Penicillium odoratum]